MFAIDISKWNGVIDFKKLAKATTVLPDGKTHELSHVVIRTSEGVTEVDPMFVNNVKGCYQNQIPVEFYHFATWNNPDEVADATNEAIFFSKQIKVVEQLIGGGGASRRFSGTLYLDTETNKSNIILSRAEMGKYIDTFFNTLELAGYNNFGLYASPGFVDSFYPLKHKYGDRNNKKRNLKFWVANYNGKKSPKLPNGFSKYDMWQFTDNGKINGVPTRCDVNVVK